MATETENGKLGGAALARTSSLSRKEEKKGKSTMGAKGQRKNRGEGGKKQGWRVGAPRRSQTGGGAQSLLMGGKEVKIRS